MRLSAIGNIASGIQAGNALTVNAGGQILNTGNLLGSQVDLTGSALVNGYTSPNQPTPPTTVPQQVIPLAPPAAPGGSLPTTTASGSAPGQPTAPGAPQTTTASGSAPGGAVADAQTPGWSFQPAIVTTPAAPGSQTVNWHFTANLGGNPLTAPGADTHRTQYLTGSPATSVLAGVTPDYLLSQLPANLQPGSRISFYYDPYTEDQRLQQAALQQTGQASFINGLAYDSQNQLSVTDQEKLTLYQNAADYAKANNIALGTALTQTQIGALDKPMLWYVEQSVPDPGCNTVASTVCPMVSALVPQVYLPEGYAQALATPNGGVIAGKDVSLDIAGNLRNSGMVTASDTLTVKAASLDLAPNVVDVGTSAYRVQGGYMEYFGTQVQPGGFLSAANLDIQAGAIHAVNDALRVTNDDGSTNAAATQALISQLQASLGENYTAGTAADDIQSKFLKDQTGGLFGSFGAIIAIAAAVAISIATAGSGTAIVGALTNAAFVASTTGTALAAGVSGLIAGTLSSMTSQLILTGSIDMGSALKTGLVAGVTAGFTAGALGAMGLSNAGINSIGDNIAKGNWAAVQANLGNYVEATLVRSAISAGINTAAYGGSFGQAFANGLVRDAAAVGANAIGVTVPGIGTEGATAGTILANATAHALLGCAAQSLSGGDCAGGAIGGAASAIAAPLIRDGLYDGTQTVVDNGNGTQTTSYNNLGYNAATVALATLIGGSAGALLGANATAAALAAQNEALNNSLA